MNTLDPGGLWPVFRELEQVAAAETLPRFRTVIDVENKADTAPFDPVTEADRAAERAIRATLARHFPDHGVSGEEGDDVKGSGAWSWIVDPIDGTRSFISGMPTWGTLVGLLEDGVPRFGMMSQPYVGECFLGGGGKAEWFRGDESRLLRCRAVSNLGQATLFATSPDMFAPGFEADAFSRLSDQTQLTRFGADCYGYVLLAAGFVDLVVEANLGFYDVAPVIPIVEAAGGCVSDWAGQPVRSGGRAVAAANEALLEQALSSLGG